MTKIAWFDEGRRFVVGYSDGVLYQCSPEHFEPPFTTPAHQVHAGNYLSEMFYGKTVKLSNVCLTFLFCSMMIMLLTWCKYVMLTLPRRPSRVLSGTRRATCWWRVRRATPTWRCGCRVWTGSPSYTTSPTMQQPPSYSGALCWGPARTSSSSWPGNRPGMWCNPTVTLKSVCSVFCVLYKFIFRIK